MSTSTPRITRSLNTALIAASVLLQVSAASAAAPAPSTVSTQQEVWKQAKFPWLYPATAVQNHMESAPVPSQQEIWMRTKFPWKFHTTTGQGGAPSAPVLTQQEIWKRAKSAR